METKEHRARYRRIVTFAALQLPQFWWFELVLPRFGLASIAERTRTARVKRLARRFHALAIDLGGLMIKVGQFMSARLDVLPPEITDELAGLQDEVPAVPFPAIRALAEAELGVPLERAFAWFDETPVAAASLGQVHRARLSALDSEDTGLTDVVFKVQRPGIDKIVAVDLAALRKVAGWLNRVRFVSSRVDAPALVEEFAVTSLEEIDYLHEAASAEKFADNFAADERVNTPAIVWERTTRRVLTMADVSAIKISDTEALVAAGIDPVDVATVFGEIMFEQAFTYGFVHADPHPGNIFVTPRPAGASGPAWKLTFIDFGMMAHVPSTMRGGLRTLVVAVASRDGKGLVSAAQQLGVLLPSANTVDLERAMTALFARFGGLGASDLRDVDPREFEAFAEEFGDAMRSLPLQLPEDMLLLIRAVSLTSGMCTALSPTFNIWDAVDPHAARLIREETGNVAQDFGRQALANVGTVWNLPKRIDSIITRIDEGNVTFDTSRLERRIDWLITLVRRAVSAVLFAALLIGGALLLAVNPVLATVLMSVSVLPLLHALFGGRGARRL